MKNIRVEGLEWRDKINGNSYFSSRGYVDGELAAVLPFQYGYGDHYIDQTWRVMVDKLHLPVDRYYSGGLESMWRWCEAHNVKHSSCKHSGLKREVVKFGVES